MLKYTPEYREIRRRGAKPKPVDAWQLNMLHYFVFEIPSQENGRASFALFTMRWEDNGPVSAVIATPQPDKKQVEVVDLRQPDNVQHVPLSDQ